MGAFLQLLRTDLVLYFSNRRAVLVSILAPILIASFFGYLFNDTRAAPSAIPVAIVDLDGSELSGKLVADLRTEKLFAIQTLSEAEGLKRVAAGTVKAAVMIPPGFGQQAGWALLSGRDKPQVRLYFDPSQNAALQAVRGLLAQHVMQTVSAETFSPTSSTLPQLRDRIAASPALPAPLRASLLGLFKSIGQLPADRAGSAANAGLNLPYALSELPAGAHNGTPYNSYAHSFAGMTVQFVLFMGIDIGIGLLTMRRLGLWQRLRAAPLSRSVLLGSRIASGTLIALVLTACIYAFAMLVFKVRIEGSWPGFLGVCLAFALMTASFGLMIAALGRTPEATRGLAIVTTLLLVMLGGAWVPTFVFPSWMQRVAQFAPTRWAVDGLDAMSWRGQGLHAAAAPVALMLGATILFAAIAVQRFSWDE